MTQTPWSIRFKQQELKLFKQQAEKEGISLAAWVRKSLNQSLEPNLRERLRRLERILLEDE